MSKIRVSIITVHYGAYKDLLNCLKSIENNPPKCLHEVIVVDNDERQKIKKDLKQKFPWVRYFKSAGNIGFGAANNLGVNKAEGKYLFFLNPDTRVLPKSIDKLIDFLSLRNDVGIVAPLLLDNNGIPYQLQGSGPLNPLSGIIALSFINKVFPTNPISKKYFLLDWDKQEAKEVAVMPGTALMMKKSLFNQVGGFDPNFFLYFEESDLAKRVKEYGFKIYIQPEAKLVHLGSRCTPKTSIIREIFQKSRLYYFKKHYGFVWAAIVHFFTSLSKKDIFLFGTLSLGAFLRFYRLSELAMFIGDQGRDYLAAKDILIYWKLPLLGPQTSIPWLYLGPFFYYFLAFFLWLGRFNPVWPTYGTAIFGVLAIYLIYLSGKKLFSEKEGLIAALFLAISPFAVLQSRIALHPSIYPVFVILFLLSLGRKSRGVKLIHLPRVLAFHLPGVIAFLIAIQLHLSALLFLPIAIVSKKPKLFRLFWLATAGLISWKLLRHSPFTPLSYWWKIFEEIFSFGNWLGAVLALLIIFYGFFWLKRQKAWEAKIILNSFLIVVVGLTIKNSQAEHYFNLFLPVVILIFSIGLVELSKLNYGKLAMFLISLFFLITNCYLLITTDYFIKTYGPGLAERIKVAKIITDDTGKNEFELARCGPLWDYPSTNDNYEYLIWWLGGKFQRKEKSKNKDLPIYIIYEPATSIEESEVCENYFGLIKGGKRIYHSKYSVVIRKN